MREIDTSRYRHLTTELLIIILAVISLMLFAIELARELTPGQKQLIQAADLTVAFVFLAEFWYRLVVAPRRWLFFRQHWWQLLAAIPVTTATTQALRGLMLLRIINIIRLTSIGMRLKIGLSAYRRFFAETKIPALAGFLIGIVLAGATIFDLLERSINQEVNSFWDSLWYVATAVTTTGGHITPITFGGQLVGFGLMFAGIITIGVFTAFVASYLVKKGKVDHYDY